MPFKLTVSVAGRYFQQTICVKSFRFGVLEAVFTDVKNCFGSNRKLLFARAALTVWSLNFLQDDISFAVQIILKYKSNLHINVRCLIYRIKCYFLICP